MAGDHHLRVLHVPGEQNQVADVLSSCQMECALHLRSQLKGHIKCIESFRHNLILFIHLRTLLHLRHRVFYLWCCSRPCGNVSPNLCLYLFPCCPSSYRHLIFFCIGLFIPLSWRCLSRWTVTPRWLCLQSCQFKVQSPFNLANHHRNLLCHCYSIVSYVRVYTNVRTLKVATFLFSKR